MQNLSPYIAAKTVEGANQILPQGPIASQESIKLIGTNGGGFLNANSAHPFENPTPLCNLFEMLAIFIIPAALTYTFGLMVRDTKQGWAIFVAMTIMWFTGVLVCYQCEAAGNPNISALRVDTDTAHLGDLGGNMEGKETHFGLAKSSICRRHHRCQLWGSQCCTRLLYSPVGSMVPLLNMELGELIFGGVRAGLYGMLIFAMLTASV